MKKIYNKQHEVCPKCGCNQGRISLLGYLLHWDKKEEYKDLNSFICEHCKYRCTIHDKISIEHYNKNKQSI